MNTTITPGQQVLRMLTFQPGTTAPIEIMSFLKNGLDRNQNRTGIVAGKTGNIILVTHPSLDPEEYRKVELGTCTDPEESWGEVHIVGSETVDTFPNVTESLTGVVQVPAEATPEDVAKFAKQLMTFLVVHGDGWEDAKGTVHWIDRRKWQVA